MDTQKIIDECVEWAKEANELLGYDRLEFRHYQIDQSGAEEVSFWMVDNFQSGLGWETQHQNGLRTIDYPPSADGIDNREQRELHVLLAQQGTSVAIADELVSAAGRRFVQGIIAERAKYAQLVDFTSGRTKTPDDKIQF